jgi:hypothetical protein
MAQMKLITQASQRIAERLTWCTASRDQAGIAKDLAESKEISEVYGLGEAGLFDEFFYFLEELGLMKHFMGLEPGRTERTSNVKFPAVILIYLMRIVAGLAFFWHIDPVILCSQSLMRLVGFNGRQIREGTCARGRKTPVPETSDDSDQTPEDSQPSTIRGPYCPDSIAAYIQAIAAIALERLFNGTVAILAAHSFFPKRIHALLDSSEIQSTEQCLGCGKVTKEKAPQLRHRRKRIRKVLETVFGFKIWVVWDPTSRLPLALRFSTIETGDVVFAREVVQQAVANLADHARIVSLAVDRGFMDGSFLWWLHHTMHITFYIPAKKDMHVYTDSLALASEGIREIRDKSRSIGSGKNKTSVVDHWDVVGIESLTSAGFYGELGSGSHENRKDFVANPINALVVLDDPFKRNNPNSDTLVILTNAPVDKPIKVYDAYDARSEIENGLFREAKQAWFIQRPARNNANAFRAHVYLTILIMALTASFQTWMDQQDKLAQKGQETGIRKFREKVRQENGNKLIVFDEDRYAIFDAYEVFILCGTNVRMPTGVPEVISPKDILLKYGALLE